MVVDFIFLLRRNVAKRARFLLDFEKRAIEATAQVQAELGCPVSFHPGRDAKAPFEIVRLYLEAGGRADKCVMSHLDRKKLRKYAR